MNKTLAWIKERTAALRNWWDEHEVQIFQKRIDDFFERLGRNIARLVVIGILLNIISAYFWPELPERIPTIYSWFDGWLQFGEFAVKMPLKCCIRFSLAALVNSGLDISRNGTNW